MPLLALIEPERYADMCASLIEMGELVGLTRWPIANYVCNTMVGNPIENMLATGRSHLIAGVDYPAALELMQKGMEKQLASELCLRDDYNGTIAIAALAGYLERRELAEKWWSKTLGYRRFFDPARKLFARSADFTDKGGGGAVSSCEGSAATYVWYNAMWDPDGLSKLLGGREQALVLLKDYVTSGTPNGRADFGNENDLHVPFIATL